ncbi:MAG: DUF4910 domain-containing protein [Gemmatimonadetes bacterium]|nr:DUF4910 domain-containing protein [Gemmatimonadota bacterium]
MNLRTGYALMSLFVLGARSLPGQERAIPFWPDAVRTAIHAHVDGVAALETVRELARFHRVHASPGFAAAAELVRQRLASAGVQDAVIERFPADGSTRYAHFRSYYGWQPVAASLQEVSPNPTLLASFPELPVALADFSQNADVTAELVDVGAGTGPEDYEGKQVAGKIVIASGSLPSVHRLAVEERGAAGFLSDFPNQTTAWSGDDRDLVRWGHLSPYQLENRFAFMLSKRQSGRLRERLARGERIVVRAQVRAKMVPGTFDVVTATIPGVGRVNEEILLTAHLDHQSAGANDNASGSAAILEVALALRRAIADGSLAPPRRTIRFLWTPEIAGTLAYLVSRPEVTGRLRAGIHMDMVGGLLGTTRGTFHLSRAAETMPHIANQIAEAWFHDVVSTSAWYAEHGGDPYDGLVWPPGSREAFLGDLRAIEMGSDHQVLQDGAFRIPTVYFHDWPDVTIHTNKDQPENLDATKLGRVAFMGAGIAWTLAALPDSEAARLVVLARASAEERAAWARARAALGGDPRDGLLFEREALAQGIETLRSVASLWPPTAAAVAREVERLRRLQPPVPAAGERDVRVPVRSADVRGPLEVYNYDHLAEVLGPAADLRTALSGRSNGEVLCYEALNLVDGRRSVSDIRDLLTGRYEPVSVREVAEYLALLERAQVVRF